MNDLVGGEDVVRVVQPPDDQPARAGADESLSPGTSADVSGDVCEVSVDVDW